MALSMEVVPQKSKIRTHNQFVNENHLHFTASKKIIIIIIILRKSTTNMGLFDAGKSIFEIHYLKKKYTLYKIKWHNILGLFRDMII